MLSRSDRSLVVTSADRASGDAAAAALAALPSGTTLLVVNRCEDEPEHSDALCLPADPELGAALREGAYDVRDLSEPTRAGALRLAVAVSAGLV